MNVHFILREALYIVLFDLKLLNEDSNWKVCMYCMHVRKGQKPPEYTSEHVKSQFFFGGGGYPYSMDPSFLYLPWAPTTLLAALHKINSKCVIKWSFKVGQH